MNKDIYGICIAGITYTGNLIEEVFTRLPKLSIFVIVIEDTASKKSLTIPKDICVNNSLTQFELHNINLNQSFPTALLDCTKLEILQLAYCELNGNLPDFSGFRDLSTLALNGNKLTGSIPSSLASLKKLKYVELYDNSLTGELPDFDSNTIAALDVRNNQLIGSVPVFLI